jgi:hypothetical protein
MKTVTAAAFALLLTGCAAGSGTLVSTFPPAMVTEPAFPTLAACRSAMRADGDPDRGCLRIDFVNNASSVIILQGLEVLLDDKLIYARLEPSGGRGDLDFHGQFTLSLAEAAAGEHSIRVGAILLVNGSVDPSLHGTWFEMRSVHSVTVPPTGALGVTIFLAEGWDKREPLEKRLTIWYRIDTDKPRSEK